MANPTVALLHHGQDEDPDEELWKHEVVGADYLIIQHRGMKLELCFEHDGVSIHRSSKPLLLHPYEDGIKIKE